MSKTHYTEQQRQELVSKLIATHGKILDKKDILNFCENNNLPNPHFLISRRDIKVGRSYDLGPPAPSPASECRRAIHTYKE
jgi:hypothetical protein